MWKIVAKKTNTCVPIEKCPYFFFRKGPKSTDPHDVSLFEENAEIPAGIFMSKTENLGLDIQASVGIS